MFGTAAAGFGKPISLGAHRADGGDLETLGVRLMGEVERVVPVLAVPLVAASVAMAVPVAALAARLEAAGAVMRLAPGGQVQAEAEGRAALQLRGILDKDGQVVPGMEDLLAFYAAPVRQRLAPNLDEPRRRQESKNRIRAEQWPQTHPYTRREIS